MELNQFRDVDVVLDKANDNIIQKQFVSAGDKDGRSLTVQLTDNGVIGEIIGAAMNLYWHNLASGLTDLSAFYVVDRATSVFKIDYPQNMLTPGKVIAYIQILHGGKVTHTKPFEITVQKLAGTTRGVLATAEYGALVTTLAKANEFSAQLAQTVSDLSLTKNTKADKVELEAIDNRISNIVASAGDGSIPSELADLKVSSYGETYTTAGDRVNNIEEYISRVSNQNDILVFKIDYSDTLTLVGSQLNGATRSGKITTLTAGKTGENSYITPKKKLSNSERALIKNKIVRIEMYFSISSDLANNIRTKTVIEAKTSTNGAIVGFNPFWEKTGELYKASIDMPFVDGDKEIYPSIRIVDTLTFDTNQTITLVGAFYYPIRSVYTTEIITPQIDVVKSIIEKETVIKHEYTDEVVVRGSMKNGTTRSGNTTTIPANNSGSGSYIIVDKQLDSDSSNRLNGKKVRFETYFSVSDELSKKITEKLLVKININTIEAEITGVWEKIDDIFKAYIDIDIYSEDTLISPKVQIDKTDTFPTDQSITFISSYFYIVEDLNQNIEFKIAEEIKKHGVKKVSTMGSFVPEIITGDYTPLSSKASDGSNPEAEFNYHTDMADDIYRLYDGLVGLFPNYITKTFLSYDSTGQLPIYQYKFIPQRQFTADGYEELPKLILISGVHGSGEGGDNPTGVYSLYYFLNDICKNWEDNPLLEYLRWNVQFVIIPVVNPWGFNNRTRHNSHDVDINRDFGNFTEIETRTVRDVVLENLDALYFADIHTMGGQDEVSGNGSWVWHSLNTSSELYYVANYHIGKISRMWKGQFGLDTSDTFRGFITQNSTSGISRRWVESEAEIPASTFELSPATYYNSRNSEPIIFIATQAIGNWVLHLLRWFSRK